MASVMRFLIGTYRRGLLKFKSIAKGQSVSDVESQLVQSIPLNQQKVTFQMHRYEELDNFFMQFLNSAETHGRLNGVNLVLLTGGENVGKSTFVEINLEVFKKYKREASSNRKKRLEAIEFMFFKSPQYLEDEIKQKVFQNEHYLVLNFDFAKNHCLSFNGLVGMIHEEMLREILNLNSKFGSKELLDAQLVKDIILAENSMEFIFVHLKDVIFSVIEGCDPILLSPEGIQELQNFNLQLTDLQVPAAQFFSNGKLYLQLIQLLSRHTHLSHLEQALQLFLSIGKRIQYEYRPPIYLKSWYSSGIESTNMLLDVLNFLAGFGKLNKSVFNDYFFKSQSEGRQSNKLQKAETNFIKAGNHIDVFMCLLNVDSLSFYENQDFNNFLDHLVARTANSSNFRTHFPVMIEIPNWSKLEEIQNLGHFNLANPLVLELSGYTLNFLTRSNIALLFNQKIYKVLFKILGRTPHTWNKAIEEVTKGKTTMDDIASGKAHYLKREAVTLEAKINRIFTYPEILPQINDNSAKYELIRYLKMICLVDGLFHSQRPAYMVEFWSSAIFECLLKEGVMSQNYYIAYLQLANLTDLTKVRELKDELQYGDFWGYCKWRMKNWNEFIIKPSEIRYYQAKERDVYLGDKFERYRWDFLLQESYYGQYGNYIYRSQSEGPNAYLNHD